MRLFVALELPNEIKTALATMQTELRLARAEVSWTKPENLHVTLKFLGETSAERASLIEQACLAAARESVPLTLSTQDLGCFPAARQPRVVWAGLTGDLDRLLALYNCLEEKLSACGFAREAKPFHPHLTLGRIKTTKNLRQLVACAEKQPLLALSFSVSELVLMQSLLQPGGSVYTPLLRARLNKQLPAESPRMLK